MESRHLFTFLVVVETGSFTRAAQKMEYAQSSITAQIQTLETELGQPLFDRIGKKIALTEAGRKLLPYARQIADIHSQAEASLKSDHEVAGTLTIGAPESLAAFRLPGIIQEYKERYPQVKMILKPGLCWQMGDQLRSGELDLAFLLQPQHEDKDLNISVLIEEEMALVAPCGHRLASAEKVLPEQLKDEVILHTESGCSYRSLFEKYLHGHGVFPDPTLEFWSIEAIKQCVISGLGLSFLPLVTVRSELASGRMVRLGWDDRSQRVSTMLAYHPKKWQSPALRELMEMTNQHAQIWRQQQEAVTP
ncbi:LysR family transcriptional regulator [Paenibacillus sp. JX-17]|uniref:LysR family transcriptional regulator n=1 Tax=Paenibacillus lacisoli TaxID=3064525 RepID=A0ABT9C8N6_9BACL|nr:LysR family transcriptional regulator [Paenibacillus sp. JX-17]MDO7905610.1 LysR family transcriptional regulator [Paenibacillus sp. JX-17]